MTSLARLVQVACMAVLAVLTITLVIPLASSTTGPAEKAVLLGMVGACLYVAAKLPGLTTRALAVAEHRRH